MAMNRVQFQSGLSMAEFSARAAPARELRFVTKRMFEGVQ